MSDIKDRFADGVKVTFILTCIVTVLYIANPGGFAIGADALWQSDRNIAYAFADVWFIFAVGLVITLAGSLYDAREGRFWNQDPKSRLVEGVLRSLNAGIFEEILFRGLLIMVYMWIFNALSWMTLGFAEWLSVSFVLPITNAVTLTALEQQLVEPTTWALGAAIVSSSNKFAAAHIPSAEELDDPDISVLLTVFRLVYTWYIGMVFVWLTFNYGLLSSILVHICYNLMVYTTVALINFVQVRRKVHLTC